MPTEPSIWKQVWTSLLGAFPLMWARIPDPIFALCGLIFVEVCLGGWYYWASDHEHFSGRKMVGGFLRKFSVVCLMLWATNLAQGSIMEYTTLNFPVYFAHVMILFTLISCVRNYVRAGGPGGPVLQQHADQLKAAASARVQERL